MKITPQYKKYSFGNLNISNNAYTIATKHDTVKNAAIIRYLVESQENMLHDIEVVSSRKFKGKLTAFFNGKKYRQYFRSPIGFIERMCKISNKYHNK